MTARTVTLASRSLFPCWVLAPTAGLVLLALLTFLGDLDRKWFVSWNRAAGMLPASFWAGVTNIGSTAGALALIAGGLAWQPRWSAAALLGAPLATAYTHGLKAWFGEDRPAAVLDAEEFVLIGQALQASSFPSGHSVTALGVAAVVGLCAVATGRQWIAWGALGVGVVVAFSRVAVGAHWPLDVLVGGAGGWLCGAFGVWWSERWRFWTTDRGVRVLAAVMAAAAGSLFFEDLGYPEGIWAQHLLVVGGLAGAALALVVGARWSRR